MFDRNILIENLKVNPYWDVIIIGGGVTGLGIATRGFKTLLLEQIDFPKGTSSRSIKLIHRGFRYLEQGKIDLVKVALYERGLMLKIASHLVGNQSFIIPYYKRWDTFMYTVGLKRYDFLAGKLSFGKSARISKEETKSHLKTIKTENLKGGVIYHDDQYDDNRLAINIAQIAIEHGATILNDFKVNELLKDNNGVVNEVVAKDAETDILYRLNAKAIINATGVFTDEILKMDNPLTKNTICQSQ